MELLVNVAQVEPLVLYCARMDEPAKPEGVDT
jgi:hypothetical protein